MVASALAFSKWSTAPGASAPRRSRRSSAAQRDLDTLLLRMRQRQYPETISVLASYWLKTVSAAGRNRAWWRDLNSRLTQALREQPIKGPERDALNGIQNWVQQARLLTGKVHAAAPSKFEPFRTSLRREWLAPYTARLLNEWLSAEVARLLVDEGEQPIPSNRGIPVLAVAHALERILLRERLSPATLEMLLQPGLLSPELVYPADLEMLRDVALTLLGRTWAPPLSVLPATLLSVAPGSPFPPDFAEAVHRASLVRNPGAEEIHVPIAANQALDLLHATPVRIASVIVTMDGRWWESETLQTGEQHFVIYKPGGLLRIDYSADHAKLVVPWPDTQLHWRGSVHFRDPFEIFGREWRASKWETDGERTWLHLVFSRVLPITEIQPAAQNWLRRARPAAVDIAWAAMENALAAAALENNTEAIEQLRRAEFVPLGRALLALADTARTRWRPKREALETHLKAVRYLEAEISLEYGRVPWRVLPAPVCAVFQKWNLDAALLELLHQVFDGLPEELDGAARRDHSASPSQAA
jgi:hypothetical protein